MKSLPNAITLLTMATLALGVASVQAAPPAPEEFVGIKWGSSKEDVKALMKGKDTRPMPGATTEFRLFFANGSAAGLSVETWELAVAQDKFWRGEITFTDNGDPDSLFKQVKKTLTEKYGTRQSESFKPGESRAEWRTENPATKEEVSIHLFTEGRNKAKRLKLEYVNETLKKQYPPPSEAKPAVGKTTGEGL